MGSLTVWSPAATFTTSPLEIPNSRAVVGLTRAALSHVNLVNGLGSSCSQPLFAKLPSWMDGSGRKTTVNPAAAGAEALSEFPSRSPRSLRRLTSTAAAAVSGTNPS